MWHAECEKWQPSLLPKSMESERNQCDVCKHSIKEIMESNSTIILAAHVNCWAAAPSRCMGFWPSSTSAKKKGSTMTIKISSMPRMKWANYGCQRFDTKFEMYDWTKSLCLRIHISDEVHCILHLIILNCLQALLQCSCLDAFLTSHLVCYHTGMWSGHGPSGRNKRHYFNSNALFVFTNSTGSMCPS